MPGLMLRSEAIAPAPLIECLGVVIVAYSPSRGAQVARKASVAWRCTRCGALHPLRGAAPVVGRCTRCGALHPNRRGVMPTDRVYCCLCCACCDGMSRSVVATAPVGVLCGGWRLIARCPVGVLCGRVPVAEGCTRCGALHPLRSAAPVVGRCTRTEGV